MAVIVASAIAWAIAAESMRVPSAALLGPPAVALGYAAFIGAEFVLLRRSYPADDPLRPTWGQMARAWLHEILLAPQVFLWRQPFRSLAQSDHVDCTTRGRRGVVLVHGFLCNRGLWNPWMTRLRAEGVPFIAVDLEPVVAPIESYASTVGRAVDQLLSATGVMPIAVGHSMGGLAIRAWMGRDKPASVHLHRVVTIATPHEGSALAHFSRLDNVRDMRPGSDRLRSGPIGTSRAHADRFVCFWSHCDNIVFPTRNATLAGADNRHLPVTAHVQMVYHPEVIGAVLELVRDGPD